ncbi:MAG: DUF1269 domain-containing protein [Acidimicrobiales bacterium]
MQMVMIGFDDIESATTALDEIEAARDDSEISLKDLALAYKSERGNPKIRQTSDAGVGKGLIRGGVLGLLVGIIAPSVGALTGAAAGGALGGVITGVGDKGVNNPMMRALATTLEENRSVLLALGDQSQIALLADTIEPYSGKARYLDVPDATQALIKEMAKLSMEDLENS